jgi:hypothetical protein
VRLVDELTDRMLPVLPHTHRAPVAAAAAAAETMRSLGLLLLVVVVVVVGVVLLVLMTALVLVLVGLFGVCTAAPELCVLVPCLTAGAAKGACLCAGEGMMAITPPTLLLLLPLLLL